MFLTDLVKTSTKLGNGDSCADYTAALDEILSVADHTNTMIWVGEMRNCPFILCGQGPLLKHGKVLSKKTRGSFKNRNKWPCHLFLFQQILVLCRLLPNSENKKAHKLEYFKHIKYVFPSKIAKFKLFLQCKPHTWPDGRVFKHPSNTEA